MNHMSEYKQVIVVRNDLNMRKGKMVAWPKERLMPASCSWSIASAKLEPMPRIMPSAGVVKPHGMTKICVRVDSEAELLQIAQKAEGGGRLTIHIITASTQATREFGGVPTRTCLAIGPDESQKRSTPSPGI